MHRLTPTLLCLALLLAARASFADKDPPKDPVARARLEIGSERYRAGDYKAAAAEFCAAYKREAHPRLLYNWAQAERLAGNCEGAVPLYRKLMDSSLPDDRRKVVALHLAECVQKLEQAAAPPLDAPQQPAVTARQSQADRLPAPAAGAPRSIPERIRPRAAPDGVATARGRHVDDDRRSWYQDPVGGVLAISAIASLGVGLTFYVISNDDVDEARGAAEHDRVAPHLEAARTHRTIAAVATVAGGGLLVAGVLRYLLHDHTAPRPPAVAIAVGDGAFVTFGGRF
jgi:hypothetical protein